MDTRRLIDVLGAGLLLAVTAPVQMLAAALIKAADGGPALFRQERIGLHGQPFTMLKFRTMTVGAEHTGLGLVVAERDSRITRPGRWLRLTSIDELPQLWNVLRGDMALVGPRPTVRSQVERYGSFERRRLDVRPGLTGWAQIKGRNGLDWDERIRLDVWYVEHRTLVLDVAIIAATPLALLRGGGHYGPGGQTRDYQPGR